MGRLGGLVVLVWQEEQFLLVITVCSTPISPNVIANSAMRATVDKWAIIIGVILWRWPVNWWSEIGALLIITWFACDLFWRARWSRQYPAAVKFPVCLYFVWSIMSWNWRPIQEEYSKTLKEKASVLSKQDVLDASREGALQALKNLPRSIPETSKGNEQLSVKPKLETKLPIEPQPQLSVEGANDSMSIIPQVGQPNPPKVSKFARIRVTNTGRETLSNVKLIVIDLNGVAFRLQLPVSSINNLFTFPNPPPAIGSVNLNPGDDQSFDAVVECNGTSGCPSGELAVLHTESGRNAYVVLDKSRVVSRLSELTVRASADIEQAVIQTFAVSLDPKGRLRLESK